MTIKRYISWKEFNGHVANLARNITNSGWLPERIVGISRGGLTAAVMLSHYFNVPMVTLDVSLRDSDIGPETNCWIPEDIAAGKRTLIVDDINDTGATINWIKQDWESIIAGAELKWGDTVRLAMLFDNLGSKADIQVDYVSEEIDKENDPIWIVFPYEEFWTL